MATVSVWDNGFENVVNKMGTNLFQSLCANNEKTTISHQPYVWYTTHLFKTYWQRVFFEDLFTRNEYTIGELKIVYQDNMCKGIPIFHPSYPNITQYSKYTCTYKYKLKNMHIYVCCFYSPTNPNMSAPSENFPPRVTPTMPLYSPKDNYTTARSTWPHGNMVHSKYLVSGLRLAMLGCG